MKKHIKKVLKKRLIDLPFIAFQQVFCSEEACRKYLFKERWPNGFVCPDCGCTEYYLIRKRGLYQCKECKKQVSVMVGTLFQDSHLPLLKWFWALYLVSRDKRGISALNLKNAVQVSYPTAWLMLQKIRQAMGQKDQEYILEGTIVVDDAYFGGVVQDKKRGRGTDKTNVLVTVSVTEENTPLFAKMTILDNLKKSTVSAALEEIAASGSMIRSDALKTIANLSNFKHEVVVASDDKALAGEILHWANIIIANAKSYILGTYHGLPKKHLQRYLNEFCYRLNRRFCEPEIFYKLVTACTLCQPCPMSAESNL